MNAARYANSFPILTHDVVTQGHSDYCAEHGHATHEVAGVESPFCPRCGQRIAVVAAVGDIVRFDNGRVVYTVVAIVDGIAECQHGGLFRSGPVESLVVIVSAEPTETEIADHEDEVQQSIAEHEQSLVEETPEELLTRVENSLAADRAEYEAAVDRMAAWLEGQDARLRAGTVTELPVFAEDLRLMIAATRR